MSMTINWNEVLDEVRNASKDEHGVKIAEHVSNLCVGSYWTTQHLITYCRTDDLQHLMDVEGGLMDLATAINKALACVKREVNAVQARELPESAEAPDDARNI
jgi:hypothetical protein